MALLQEVTCEMIRKMASIDTVGKMVTNLKAILKEEKDKAGAKRLRPIEMYSKETLSKARQKATESSALIADIDIVEISISIRKAVLERNILTTKKSLKENLLKISNAAMASTFTQMETFSKVNIGTTLRTVKVKFLTRMEIL